MRTYSLKELHERAIATLELIEKAETRFSNYFDRIEKAITYWRDGSKANRLRYEQAITRDAINRLALYYARLVERINGVLTKSLQSA